MADLFDCTAYKVLCGELTRCDQRAGGWRLPQTQLALQVVWLQGTVQQLLDGGDTAVVSDASGSVRVHGCAEVPGGTDWLRVGEYCMVVGELVSVAQVKAIKMTPLAELQRRLWPLEVEHARRHLYADRS